MKDYRMPCEHPRDEVDGEDYPHGHNFSKFPGCDGKESWETFGRRMAKLARQRSDTIVKLLDEIKELQGNEKVNYG